MEVDPTPEGQIVLTSQELNAKRALDENGKVLDQQRLGIEQLIESGREMRSHLAREQHGISEDTHGY